MMPARRRPTRGVGFLLPLFVLAATVATAHADPRLHGDFVLVLDSSGSMAGATADPSGTKSKIAVARTFTKGLFDRLGRRSRVSGGLIVFGSSFDASQAGNRAAGCRDVTVRLPLRPIDVASAAVARDVADAATARGYTPLGRAVQTAIDLLGRAGGSIVVVTDMEETCEDGTTDHACEVLARANAARSAADRVYVDSIVVARSDKMKTDAIDRLRDCTSAPRVDITNETDAAIGSNQIAERLADLAEATDRPIEEPPRRLTVLDPRGRPLIAPDVVVVLRHANTGREVRRRLDGTGGDLVVRSGPHLVSTIAGAGPAVPQGTITIAPETAEIVLSFGSPTR